MIWSMREVWRRSTSTRLGRHRAGSIRNTTTTTSTTSSSSSSSNNSSSNPSPNLTEIDARNASDKLHVGTIDWNRVLTTPQPRQHLLATNMMQYIHQYKYDIINTDMIFIHALSAVLTYPLTLAYGVNTLIPSPLTEVRILVVGARGESSLPSLWWAHTLIASYKMHSLHLAFQGIHYF